MDDVIPILGIIFGCGVPVVLGSILGFVHIRGRNAERLAMIERGIIPQEIEKPEKKSNRYPALRNGLVMIGLAVGFLVGMLIDPLLDSYWASGLTLIVMAILFGGVGFIVYFFLSRKMEHADDVYELNKPSR